MPLLPAAFSLKTISKESYPIKNREIERRPKQIVCPSLTYAAHLKIRITPNTFPKIVQSFTMMGSIVSFSGCRR